MGQNVVEFVTIFNRWKVWMACTILYFLKLNLEMQLVLYKF